MMEISFKKWVLKKESKGVRNLRLLNLIWNFSWNCLLPSMPWDYNASWVGFSLIFQLGSYVERCWKFEGFKSIKETFLAKEMKR